MKKYEFYRIFKNYRTNKITFKADHGYIYYITTVTGEKIALAIAKTEYKEWDVTHINSGLLASVKTYKTKKDAVQAIYNNNYIAALAHVSKSDQTKTCIQLLNDYKKQIQTA